MSENESPLQISPADGGFQVSFEVRAVKGERQTKKANFDQFEIICDEGKNIGGDNGTATPGLFRRIHCVLNAYPTRSVERSKEDRAP